MNFKKTMFALAIGSVGIMGATSAVAAAPANAFEFNAGATASQTGGTPSATGSWFSMLAADTDEDLFPDTNIYTGIRGFGTAGNVNPTANGVLNFGAADSQVDRTWSFFGAGGTHYSNQALEVTVVDANTYNVNMAGWTVNWNGGDINMGAGSPAVVSNVDGIWNNGNDTLIYSAVVPSGSFMGVQYGLRMQGSMAPVPEASTYGMMLAGLGLVGFAVRRRKQSI